MVIVLYVESSGRIRIAADGHPWRYPAESWRDLLNIDAVTGIVTDSFILRIVEGVR